MASRNLAELLRCLVKGNVECILVGGMAGVMRGAPVVTADVDIVHRREPDNVKRLVRVLEELQAVYRHDDRRLRPTESHLMGPGHQLLITRLGPLDALGALDNETYVELVGHASPLELGEGLSILVLELLKLIELKYNAGRPKDLAVLPVLEATLELTRK
jgi:hypothetical protein